MARINDAFETLIDPARRREYDAALAGGVAVVESPTRQVPQKPVVVTLHARRKVHHTPIYAVGFDPESGLLVSSAFDNEIVWWDESFEPRTRTKVESGIVSTLQPLRGGKVLAAGSAESVVSWWLLDQRGVKTWRSGIEEWAGCVAISPSGEYVASGSMFRTLRVATTTGTEQRLKKLAHRDAVTSLAWSPNGSVLASGSADATIKLWDAQDWSMIQQIKAIRTTVTAMAFSPDSKWLAAASSDLSIRIFDLATGDLVKLMYGHEKPIESLAFHPNGWLVASGSRDGTIGLWNAMKGVGNVRIEASSRPVSSVAFSPDGRWFVAGGQDRTVRVWTVSAKMEEESAA